MIEIKFTLYSADVLIKNPITRIDKVRKQLTDLKKSTENIFTSEYQAQSQTDSVSEIDSDSEFDPYRNLNLYIQITYGSETVSWQFKTEPNFTHNYDFLN